MPAARRASSPNRLSSPPPPRTFLHSPLQWEKQTRLDQLQLQHNRLAPLIPYQIIRAYNGVSNGAACSAWAAHAR